MKKLLLMTITLLIVVSSANISFGQSDNMDYDRMDSDLEIMTGILNKLLSGTNQSSYFRSNSQGFYLPDYGVIFTVPVRRPMSFGMSYRRLPSRVPAVPAAPEVESEADVHDETEQTISHSYRFGYADGYIGSAQSEESMDDYIEEVSVKVKDFLGIYADMIGQLSSKDKVAVYLHNASDNSPIYLVSIKKADIVAFKSNQIKENEFDNRIEYTSLIDKDDLNSQIDIMAYVLDTSMKNNRTGRSLFGSNPTVNGLYLDNFGALFLVNTGGGSSLSYIFSVEDYRDDLLILEEQLTEFSISVTPGVKKSNAEEKAERIAAKKLALRESMDAYRKSFSTLLGNYGHTLRLVKNNEWIGIVTNWDGSRSRNKNGDKRAFIMKVLKKDVNDYNSGKLSSDKFAKKVKYLEY